jgi:hypothetical protein
MLELNLIEWANFGILGLVLGWFMIRLEKVIAKNTEMFERVIECMARLTNVRRLKRNI